MPTVMTSPIEEILMPRECLFSSKPPFNSFYKANNIKTFVLVDPNGLELAIPLTPINPKAPVTGGASCRT
jgi:hypothetical protein